MAAVPMDYGALLRLAAPCGRLIVLEVSAGEGVRGGGATAATHRELLLRRILLGGGALSGIGGGAAATAHELQIRQGGALPAGAGSGGPATALAHDQGILRQILRGGGDEAATGHGTHVRLLLLGSGAHPSRGEGLTATDHEPQLLGALTSRAAAASTVQVVGIGVALTTGGAGAGFLGGRATAAAGQGLQPCQALGIDRFLPLWPLRPPVS